MGKVLKRPLPQNAMTRVRTLAKELAEGAIEEAWGTMLSTHPYEDRITDIQIYLRDRWSEKQPSFTLLISNGYLESNARDAYRITEKAFDLVEEVEPTSIFISYKRSESSAFAMFVLTRLKMDGLEPFLDMSLIPGENWHAGLAQRIKEHNYDYLIVLIGQETLKSEICLKEIGWAIEAGLGIIPVWHNKFEYQSAAWNLPSKIDEILRTTHTIRVLEESASGYNTAIVELLNVFGITP